VYQRKCQEVYQHVYESYSEAGRSIYTTAAWSGCARQVAECCPRQGDRAFCVLTWKVKQATATDEAARQKL
jgi:hypothetical protein